MSLKIFNRSIFAVVSFATTLAVAQLTPGPSHGGGNSGRPPQYNPCDVPSDPNCPGRPGQGGGHYPSDPYPGRPGQPGGPGYPNPNPGNPSYPSYPTYPSDPYPSNPYPSNPNSRFGYYTNLAINNQLGYCTVVLNVSYDPTYNQAYINGEFRGNYVNGYENNKLENFFSSAVSRGNCGYINGNPSYPPNQYNNIRIINANYYGYDVTNSTQNMCSYNQNSYGCSVVPTQSLNFDPAYGVYKRFTVTYTCNNSYRRTAVMDPVRTNESLYLNCN